MPSDSQNNPSSSGDSAVVARQFPTLQPLGTYAHLDPIALHRPITLIGSRRSARIHLNSSNVSRAHAVLVVTPAGCVIRDLHSREGTDVDGERIDEHRLTAGQIIKIGEFTFRYDDPRAPVGDVRQAPPMMLRIKTPAGQKEVALRRVVTLVGKRTGSDVELPFADVSTANTVIVRIDVPADQGDAQPGYLLYDLGGKGTKRNGQQVHRGRFRPGDKLHIGPASLRIAPAADAAPAVAERRQEVAEPVEDRDEIVLEEPLAEDSGVAVAEDLLGDSHVMEALAEPEVEAGAEAGEESPQAKEAQDAALEEAPEGLDTGSEAGAAAFFDDTPAQADAADLGLVPETEDAAADEAEAQAPPVDEAEAEVVESELDAQDLQEREQAPEPVVAREEIVEEAPALEVEAAEDEAEPVVQEIGQALTDDEQTASAEDAVESPEVAEESDDDFELALAALSDQEEPPEEAGVGVGEEVRGQDEADEVVATANEEDDEEAREAPPLALVEDEVDATPDDTAEEAPPIAVVDEQIDEEEETRGRSDALELEAEEPGPAAAEPPEMEMPDLSRTDFSGSDAVDEAPEPAEEEIATEPAAEAPGEGPAAPTEVATPEKAGRRRKGNRRRHRSTPPTPTTAPPVVPSIAASLPEEEAAPPKMAAETTGVAAAASPPEIADPAPGTPPVEAEAPLELSEGEIVADTSANAPAPVEVSEAPPIPGATDDAAAIASLDEALADLVQAQETEPTPESAFSLDTVFDGPDRPHATSLDLAMASDDGRTGSASISDEQFLASLDALGDQSGEPVEPLPRPADAADAPGEEAGGENAEQPPEFIDEPSRSATSGGAAGVELKQHQEDWRGDWQAQESAFIGNTNPLDLRPQTDDASAKRKEPGSVAEPTSVHAAQDSLAPADAPEAPTEPVSTSPKPPTPPSAPPVPAARDADRDGDVLELSRAPEIGDRSRPRAGRPHRVGFGEPVAEIDESEAPLAAGPFSSAPVSHGRGSAGRPAQEDPAAASDDDYYGPLDPSAGMPETSGLTGAADVFSLGYDGPAEIPEFGTDPSTGTDQVDSVGTATAVEPPPGDEVDGFLRTIREGVGSSGLPALSDLNGHGGDEDLLPEAISEVEEAALPRGRRTGGRRRNGHPVPPPAGRRGRAAVPATQLSEDERARAALLAEEVPSRHRKFIFVPLLFATAVVAMIGAIVAIWIGMAPRTPVSMKVRYDVPQSLDEDARRSFQENQQMLLAKPDTRPLVLEHLRQAAPNVDADFLIDPVAYNRFALGAYWSQDEPDTLVLERPSIHPEEEMARLKAVAAALYEKSRGDRRLLERSDQTSRQLQSEIADLSTDIETLNRRIGELAANLPETDGDPVRLAARESELRERIAGLDELWTRSDRRVAELKQELSRMDGQNPLADDARLRTLRDRLAEIEQQLEDLSTGSEAPAQRQSGSWHLVSTQLRARPAAFDADGPEENSTQASPAERIATLADQLLAEMLPAHLKSAAVIEMARAKVQRLEGARYDELVAADAEAQRLSGDISLRERQLNAARADGVEAEIRPLEMTLRVLRNRLDVRQRSLRVDAANAPEVMAAAQELEASTRTRTQQMRSERDAILQTLDELLAERVEGSGGTFGSLEATAIRASLAAAVFEQARRSPVTAAIWLGVDGFDLPEDEPEADEAGEAETASWILAQDAASQPAVDPVDPVELQEELARVQRAIERREAEIRGELETTGTRLRQQLASAEATASKAQREAQEARAELSQLMAGRDSDQAQRQRLAELRAQKADAEGRITDLQSQLTAVQERLQRLAVPRPPSDVDVARSEVEDKRIEYIIYSMIAISMFTLAGFFVIYRGS